MEEQNLFQNLDISYGNCLEANDGFIRAIQIAEYTNVSVCNATIYFIYFKIVYRQGDMFRPSLGHPQALKGNRSKITRVGTLIVATIYLQLIQNRYMIRSFTVLQCSHQHCVQPVASDVEVVGYL